MVCLVRVVLLSGYLYIVQGQLNMVLGFCTVYCMAVHLDLKPSVRYGQLRRLCREILIHFVFTLAEALLGASCCMIFCCSAATTACATAALPSGYEPTWCYRFNLNHVLFQKRVRSIRREPNQYHGWITLQRSLIYEDELGKVMSGVETAACNVRGGCHSAAEGAVHQGNSPLRGK